jgi:myo-inositol-1(or 4)-monophosphatase
MSAKKTNNADSSDNVSIDKHDLRKELVAILEQVSASCFGCDLVVSDKGDDGVDLVTSLDYVIQELLVQKLSLLLRGSKVVGEEEFDGLDPNERYVWLVDPLDGTVNFVSGLPCYAIAVVLLEYGQPCLAAVHDVPRNVTYSACTGAGAMCDDSVMKAKDNRARLGCISSGLVRNLARNAPGVLAELLTDWKLRNLGSQSLQLCYLAEGKVKFVASYEARAWDDLAGSLIAREAGLVYGHYSGNGTPSPSEPQMSLCTHAEFFDGLATRFAKSMS